MKFTEEMLHTFKKLYLYYLIRGVAYSYLIKQMIKPTVNIVNSVTYRSYHISQSNPPSFFVIAKN